MKKSKYIKRALIMLLCGALSLTAVPARALADETGSDDYYAQAEERKEEEIQSNLIDGWPEGPAIGAEGAILMEAETGTSPVKVNWIRKCSMKGRLMK